MAIPKIFTTLSIPETTFYELYLCEAAEIKVINGKAIFTFAVNENLAAARRAFDGGAQVNVRDFVDSMKSLKRRMHIALMEETNGG